MSYTSSTKVNAVKIPRTSQTSLTQIFDLTDDSEIPIDIEDATLQVIKKDC